jgi:Flp pilus assembly pilin Flp
VWPLRYGAHEGHAGGRGSPLTLEEDLHMSDILLRPIIAMQVAVHQLREREDGQTTTEYAILLGFLAIAIIIALFFLRGVLRSLFSAAASSVSRAPNSG